MSEGLVAAVVVVGYVLCAILGLCSLCRPEKGAMG